jgi:four helix bundle protein
VSAIAELLKQRSLRFAVRIAGLCQTLPETREGRHVADQRFRSGTGVAANYYAACRARSRREFVSKMGLVVEEAEETLFWLEFMPQVGLTPNPDAALLAETRELLAIFTASAKTARSNLERH